MKSFARFITKLEIIYLITSTVIGIFFALQYTPFNILPSIFLILFILITLITKNYSTSHYYDGRHIDKFSLGILESVLVLLAMYFGFYYSIYFMIILFILSLFMQLEFLFSYHRLMQLYTFTVFYVFMGVFNLLSFYLQTRFISAEITTIILGTVLIFSLPLYLWRKRKAK